MLRLHAEVLRLRFYDIVLKFFHELVHEYGGAGTHTRVFGEHHAQDRDHQLVWCDLSQLLDADFDVAHADLAHFFLIVSETLDHEGH